MPRYYRRRATRVVKPKKKWASNMRQISIDKEYPAADVVSRTSEVILLCANGAETDFGNTAVPTPTIIKTGNYKVQADVFLRTSAATLVNVMMYVVFVPEGNSVIVPNSPEQSFVQADNLVRRHPEWILAWRQVTSDFLNDSNNIDRVTFSSRLKRNLNSGDQIYLVVTAANTAVGGGNLLRLGVNGMCQFWTCNN